MKNLSRYFFKNKRDFLMTILGDVLLALSMVAWSFFMKNLAEAAEQTDFSAILRLGIFTVSLSLFSFDALFPQKIPSSCESAASHGYIRRDCAQKH